MARTLNKLTNIGCKAVSTAGRHSDGGGLYLYVGPSGAKSWAFVWTRDKRKREMGLGAYPAVSLGSARKRADQCRTAVAEGRDPIEEKKSEAEPTFADCADLFLATMEGQWRNEKHRAQWRMTLSEYCKPIATKQVSKVNTDDVLRVLNPIWQEKHETASRLRGRIERVLDFAKARGWREGENPALWRGHLKNILPARQKLTRGHHAAMPYQQISDFLERVREAEAMSARALEFLILTAARSGEVLGAQWNEIDFDKAVWTLPAMRMKAGKEHRVPLSERALDILRPLQEARVSEFVFPGQKPGKPLSGMAITMLLRRLKADQFTPHGFRSAFRDWAGDCTHFQREVAEQALAHRVGDETERAYRRADALEKRRELMMAWAKFCEGQETDNVVPLAVFSRA